jgi:hypothetical protein
MAHFLSDTGSQRFTKKTNMATPTKTATAKAPHR